MKKRIVSLLLCLCMVFSLLPVSALAALNTGHKIDVTFKVLYVGDEFNIGYNYGSSEQTQFVCQYTTNHSDEAYSNHIIAISDIKAAAGRATVNSGYQIVGWSKEANANPKTWDLNMGGTTACNKGTPIYLVAKNPNPTPTMYTYHLIHEFNYAGGTRWDITATTAAESYQLDVNNGKPTRNGYSFAGWAEKANAAAAKERITLTKDNPTKTIYAVWMPFFELRYDANGGTNAPANQTRTASAPTVNKVTFTVPDQAPTKADYTFKGWADSANATEAKYRPGGTIDVQHKDSPKIVYAVWEKNDSPMPDTPVPPSYDDLKSAIRKIQVKDVSTPNCGTKNYDLIDNTSNDPFNWTKTARLDQPGKYDVTIKTAPYVAKYNSEIAKAHELNDASQTTLKLVISYKNSKWVLDDGKTEIKVKHTESTPAETPPEAPTADELEKLEMAVQVKCVVDDSQQHKDAYDLLGKYDEDYFVGAPKKDGDDWLCEISYDPDLYVAEFNTAFPNLKHVRNDEKIVPVTLIWADGSWQLKTQGSVHVTEEYTVTFNAYGGFPTPDEQHVKSGEKAVLPAEPTLKGHTFAFWYLGDDEENATAYDFDTPVTGDITLKAQWTLNTYNIASTLRVNNGEPVKDEGKTYSWTYRCGGKYGETIDYQQMIGALKARALKADKANEPCDAEIKLCFPGSTDSFSDAIKTYGQDGANWQAANNNTAYIRGYATTSYEVIFNSDGGSDVVTQIVKYGEKAEAPEAPTMKGYNFLGWFDKDGNPFNFDTSITHKTELTARWEKKTYTVVGKLYLNGKPVMKADGTSQYLSTPLTGLYGEAIDYTSTKTWAENLVLTDIDLANEPIKATVKIYKDGGTWDPSATFGNPDVSPNYVWVDVTTYYEVVFNTGVEGLTVDTQTVKYGDKVEKPEDPTREGYKFLGWFKDGEDTAFDFDTPITQKTELTARWEKKTYTVTFDPNCGAVEPTSKTVTFDDAYGDLPTPTRAHHTFKGWYLGTDKVTEATIVKTAENHTLRAAWSRSYHALTINYVDKKGNPVADSYEASVALGADFSVTSPDVKGYKLRDKDDAVIEGTMTAEGYTYDVVYVKKSSGGSGVQIESPNKPEKDNSLKFNTAEHFAYVNGYPDGTVKPTGDVTRAEVAAILYRVMDADCVKTYETTRCSFSDVVRGDWFNTYVATLENAGVIVDTRTNGKFRPNEAITRAELAAMLAQFADIKSAANSFNDVSARHWASDEIAVCAKMGWINGYPDGSFRPDATITRAEMMAMINRALDRTPKSVSDLLSGMKTWSDNANTGAWYYLDVQEATNSHTYMKSGTHETWKKLH